MDRRPGEQGRYGVRLEATQHCGQSSPQGLMKLHLFNLVMLNAGSLLRIHGCDFLKCISHSESHRTWSEAPWSPGICKHKSSLGMDFLEGAVRAVHRPCYARGDNSRKIKKTYFTLLGN